MPRGEGGRGGRTSSSFGSGFVHFCELHSGFYLTLIDTTFTSHRFVGFGILGISL